MTPEQLQAVADRVVAMAQPGEQVEAVAAWSKDTEIRAYDGSIEHFVASEAASVGVRVVRDGRQGLSWAGVLDDDAVQSCLAEARDNARFSSPDPFAGLAAPDGVEPVALDVLDPALASEPTERKLELALDLEAAVRNADRRVRGVESADYADSLSTSAIASTAGIRRSGSESSVYLGADALACEGDDTSTGYGFSVARGIDGLDPSAAAHDAVERSLRMLGATKAPSARLTVVFDPYVSSQFLGLVAELLSGEAVLKGRSPFAERVGDRIAAESVQLCDDAIDPAALSASDVDGEGLACRRVPLLRDGVLEGFLHNAYTARATGARSTGSASRAGVRSAPGVGPHVIKLEPGVGDLEQIVAGVGDGLLVRELVGLHSGVNPVSGDLSVGVEGQRIRGGSLCESVREVTIASTLQRMLLQIVAVGSDLTYFPWEATGVSMAIEDLTMSGT